MKRFIWRFVIVCFLTFCQGSFSEKGEGRLLDKKIQQDNAAYERLLKAKRFTIVRSEGAFTTMGTPTGKPPRQPQEISDFQLLLKAKYGKESFKLLVEKGTVEGQLYGLCGLYFLDDEEFKKGVEKLSKSDKAITHLKGDIMSRLKIKDIVNADTPTKVKLKNKEQSLKNWFKENEEVWSGLKDWVGSNKHFTKFHQKKFVVLDIKNGGLPVLLKSLKKPEMKKKK